MRKTGIGFVAAALVAGGLAVAALAQSGGGERPNVNTGMHGDAAGAAAPDPGKVTVPDSMTGPGYFGQLAFERSCIECHGKNAAGGTGNQTYSGAATPGGTGKGPPLIHPIYEPGHHPDTAFLRAAFQGVPAHHWNFGDMPPVDGITQREVELISTYVREVQRANGIE